MLKKLKEFLNVKKTLYILLFIILFILISDLYQTFRGL